MLLKIIVLGLEGEHKALIANLAWNEFNIECMIGLRHNRVVHRATFKAERLICDCIKADRRRDLTLILQHDLQVVVLPDSRASKLQCRCAICFEFIWLGDL